MNNTIIFTSQSEFEKSRGNIAFWWPYIQELLIKHELPGTDNKDIVICGDNPTYPVFLIGDIVIKFFGHTKSWQSAFNTESHAHETLLKDKTILAPQILAKGQLFTDKQIPWPYIISSKVSGKAWLNTNLTYEHKARIAKEIGEQLGKIHNLNTNPQLKHDHTWLNLDLTAAAEKSILPAHLVKQVSTYISKLDPFDKCFVNGDIVPTHVFVQNNHLSGIIDWGDATFTDRHYELGKLMNTFNWNKQLLQLMLEGSNWPVTKNFAKQALGLSLYRQAVGLTQHSTFDVFYQLPNIYPLDDIATLDELATVLFAIE